MTHQVLFRLLVIFQSSKSKANRIALRVMRLKGKSEILSVVLHRDISIHDFSHCHDDYSQSKPATKEEKPTLYRVI